MVLKQALSIQVSIAWLKSVTYSCASKESFSFLRNFDGAKICRCNPTETSAHLNDLLKHEVMTAICVWKNWTFTFLSFQTHLFRLLRHIIFTLYYHLLSVCFRSIESRYGEHAAPQCNFLTTFFTTLKWILSAPLCCCVHAL